MRLYLKIDMIQWRIFENGKVLSKISTTSKPTVNHTNNSNHFNRLQVPREVVFYVIAFQGYRFH